MKYFLRYSLFLLLIISFSFSTSAKDKDYRLILKTSVVKPESNLHNFIKSDISSEEIFNGKFYRLVQFNDIPTNAQKDVLEKSGVEILNYIPNYTYQVSFPKGFDKNEIQNWNARSIIKLSNKQKMGNKLLSGEYPEWAVDGNQIDVILKYYDDISSSQIVNEINQKGYEILHHNPYSKNISIRIPQDKIQETASKPYVSFMMTVDPPSKPENLVGRTDHRSNIAAADYDAGRHYDGSGISVGVLDNGTIGPHIDYEGRIGYQYAFNNTGDHGDHVSGTIMGAGNLDPVARGMAFGAELYVYDAAPSYQGYDSIYSHYNLHNIRITSCSYSNGCNAGYTSLAQTLDQQVRTMPGLMHVFSAGNNGNSDCGYGAGSGWGNVTGGHKIGKNVIAVANLQYNDNLASSSSRGPAHDGRIKPDISAVGTSVYSTVDPNTYSYKTGTSMSCPGVAGTLAQLYQAYEELNGGQSPQDGGLMKGLILNTADDIGNSGPDYKHGWGRINAKRAVQVLEQNNFLLDSVQQGDSVKHTLNVPAGTDQFRVMVYWTDYEGAINTNKALVNDLNMRVEDPTSTSYLPWVLDPTPNSTNLNSPAVRAVDSLNNMEQVTIDNPTAGNHTITIRGDLVPQGPQKYYIIYEFITDDVELTYPVGGEGLVPGDNEVIRWDALGNSGSFTLEYSTDSGTTWNTISSTVSQSIRYFNWTVPNTVTGDALMRVSRGSSADTSKSDFSIIDVPQNLSVTYVCPDSMELSWNSVPNATSYEVSMLGQKYMDSIATSTTTSVTLYNYNPYVSRWFSVKAKGPNGASGRRAVAINYPGGLLNCTINEDLKLADITNPPEGKVSDCQDLDSIQVTVLIENTGVNSISNFPVNYQINGGTVVTETYSASIPSGNTVTHTFSPYEDLSIPGTYVINAYTSYTSDGNNYNDSLESITEVISGTVSSLPWNEDFESYAQCGTSANCGSEVCPLGNGWINIDNGGGDDIDFRVNSGGTNSNSTGPVMDFDPGTSSGKYVYTEASGTCTNMEAQLISPCIDLTAINGPELRFAYHMYGSQMGSMHVDIYYNGAWVNDITSVKSGDQGTSWLLDTVDLTPYTGQVVNIRFRGITGTGFRSDMALDAVSIVDMNAPPVTDFTADVTNTCPSTPVRLEDLSTKSPTNRSWTITPNTYSFTGGTTANSANPEVLFNSAGTYTIKLVASNSFGADSVTKSSYITIGSGMPLPYSEDFESFSICGTTSNCEEEECPTKNYWVNKFNMIDDDIDWRTNSGGTPSANTGPTMDYNPGTSWGKYMYTEASGGCTGKEAYILTPCLDLSGTTKPQLTFAYHMTGSAVGDLHVDVLSNGSWNLNAMTTLSGDQGSSWNIGAVDLSAYTGQDVKVRFRGVTGTSWESDISIDDIMVEDVVSTSEHTSLNGLTVFPNPADGVFNYKFLKPSGNGDIQMRVVDIRGKLIVEKQLENNSIQEGKIDLSNHADGVYYLKVTGDEQQEVIKLIKQ